MKTARRLRRQVVKEGRCPPWNVIKNCSSLEQCNWDGDCSGSQKCCKSTCETRSCYQPILAIGPGEGINFNFLIRLLIIIYRWTGMNDKRKEIVFRGRDDLDNKLL